MNDDQFFEHYKPIQNHLVTDAPEGGCMFETYGPELDFVKTQEPKKVWTVLEVDGLFYYAAGFHHVNRMGYLITEVPWETGEEEIECEDLRKIEEENA